MNWKYKLTSRKFWAAVADFVGMLLVFLNYSQDRTVQVTALIMAGAGVLAYILGEGLADCANVINPTIDNGSAVISQQEDTDE